jgi:hypothetical protein
VKERSEAIAGAWAGPAVGVTFVGGVLGGLALADAPFPRPGSTPEQVRRYFTGSARAARVSVAGQLLSSMALVRFTAAVAELAGQSDPTSRALRTTALAGGTLASGALATSAIMSAALTGRRGRHDDSAAKLHRRSFVAGGPAHGIGFGLLVGALGIAGARTGRMPRLLIRASLASAASGLLTPLYLVTEPAAWLIPAGRFSGLLISGIAGTRLARGR